MRKNVPDHSTLRQPFCGDLRFMDAKALLSYYPQGILFHPAFESGSFVFSTNHLRVPAGAPVLTASAERATPPTDGPAGQWIFGFWHSDRKTAMIWDWDQEAREPDWNNYDPDITVAWEYHPDEEFPFEDETPPSFASHQDFLNELRRLTFEGG